MDGPVQFEVMYTDERIEARGGLALIGRLTGDRGSKRYTWQVHTLADNELIWARVEPAYIDTLDAHDGLIVMLPTSNPTGVNDYVLQSWADDESAERRWIRQWSVVSGEDVTVARTVRPPRAGTRGHGFGFASPGDVTGDGIPDIAIAERGNATKNYHMSHFALIGGDTGETIWEIPGDAVDTQATMEIRVPGDPHDGEKWPEPQFQGPIVTLPDLTGDGVNELATRVVTHHNRAFELLVVAGATGEKLGRLRVPEGRGWLTAGQAILLDSIDGTGRPGVLTHGEDDQGDYFLAVLDLERLSQP